MEGPFVSYKTVFKSSYCNLVDLPIFCNAIVMGKMLCASNKILLVEIKNHLLFKMCKWFNFFLIDAAVKTRLMIKGK